MSNTMKIEGRAWVIRDPSGRAINDIDTDMIYHNAHLAVTDVKEMGKHSFGNLDGWKDFPSKVKAGDIIIAGSNFGCGSSRQHAVDCFRSLGAAALVVESVGAIYKRNAINSAFPLLVVPGALSTAIANGDIVSLDFESGELSVPAKGIHVKGIPFSSVQKDIFQAGSLFKVRPQGR
ncbi:MAG: 3-isopropylmalate dehydratase [Candidatus Brocadiia bacterium]